MNSATYAGGENFNLRDVLLAGHNLKLNDRLSLFDEFIDGLNAHYESLYMREIDSAADREVTMTDPVTGESRRMLMFGSNNYLGLANHPALKEATIRAVEKFGAGSGSARLICGSLAPHHELEELLAAFKGTAAALSFSSGYATAIGTITALLGKEDIIIVDKLVHACIVDAARLSGAKLRIFAHNDLEDLGGWSCVHDAIPDTNRPYGVPF